MTNSMLTHAAYSLTLAMHRLVASIGGVLIWAAGAIMLISVCCSPQARAADSKIVFDYAAFCEENATRQDCFYDASLLPYPKEAIITAIERQIVRSPSEAHLDWLRSGAFFMWNFLEGVGPDPLPFGGLESQGSAPADPETLRRVWASPEYQRDVERSSHFIAIAEREKKEVEERIATALRIQRALRHSRQAVQTHPTRP